MKRAIWAALILLALFTPSSAQTRGVLVECILTTTATTSTLVTGCNAPGDGYAIWITDISVYGDAATIAANPATVQSGEGSTCGTGTKIHHLCQHAAVSGCEAHFQTASRAVPNGNICVLDANAGTKHVAIKGYVGPR